MADERDEIRARIDLVELVGQRVALKRAGKNWKGLCPFHNDRNPSFYVSPDIGYYRCWSCGEKGDAFTWLMKTQNLEFREALELLARQAGVTLRPRSGEVSKGESELRAAAMEDAMRFFVDQLAHSSVARKYCENRGLDDETIQQWELGYAPDVGEALAIHLQKKKHSLALCKSLFLVDEDAGGGFYDRFRGRLMFPIRDERGQLVAFGGRIIGDSQPKYVNSGDTPIYRKSRVLYGLNRAKTALLEKKRAVLVEGYLDVIACHRAGVTEAVASLGTAFAEDHARLLKRWCDHATILYDADEAGQKAAERASEILRAAGLGVSVALVPKGDDPDTLLRREGPAAVQRAATQSISPLDFSLRRIAERNPPNSEEFWKETIGALAACLVPSEVDRHVTEIAANYMASQPETSARATLYSRIKDQRRALQRRVAGSRAVASMPFRSGMAAPESVVFRAFLDEALRRSAWEAIREPGLLWSEPARRLGEGILQAFPEAPPAGPPKAWLAGLSENDIGATLADVEFAEGYQTAGKLIADALTASTLESALEKLRKARGERQVTQMKKEDGGDERLTAIMAGLRIVKDFSP